MALIAGTVGAYTSVENVAAAAIARGARLVEMVQESRPNAGAAQHDERQAQAQQQAAERERQQQQQQQQQRELQQRQAAERQQQQQQQQQSQAQQLEREHAAQQAALQQQQANEAKQLQQQHFEQQAALSQQHANEVNEIQQTSSSSSSSSGSKSNNNNNNNNNSNHNKSNDSKTTVNVTVAAAPPPPPPVSATTQCLAPGGKVSISGPYGQAVVTAFGNVQISLAAIDAGSVPAPPGTAAGTSFFQMNASACGSPTQLAVLPQEVNLAVTYNDSAISGLDKTKLTLYFLSGGQWLPAPKVSQDPADNTVAASVTGLGVYALVQP